MPNRLSRRKLAIYIVDKLEKGVQPSQALKEVAAYLIGSRRTREIDLMVRDVEDELALRGIVVADVMSAHVLTTELKQQIGTLIGAKSLQLRETVDTGVLGGMRIDIPGKRFDGTLRHKLTVLRTKQL